MRHPFAATRLPVCCSRAERLDHWCPAERHPEAMVAGFFVRDPYRPLGEVRIGGARSSTSRSRRRGPGAARASTSTARCGSRRAGSSPTTGGDLVQAGPLLVRDGRR